MWSKTEWGISGSLLRLRRGVPGRATQLESVVGGRIVEDGRALATLPAKDGRP